ncbi:hypothetical protein ACLOJK_011758 [Asimina triloba]
MTKDMCVAYHLSPDACMVYEDWFVANKGTKASSYDELGRKVMHDGEAKGGRAKRNNVPNGETERMILWL